jgi:hypothetical protein
MGRRQAGQHRLDQGLTLNSKVDHDQATILHRGLALDITNADQTIDRAGQGRAIGADDRRQGRHRGQAFLVQGVQHQPLTEDDTVLAQPVAHEQAAGLLRLEKQSVQVIDIERQKSVPAFVDKLSTQKPGFQMTAFRNILN